MLCLGLFIRKKFNVTVFSIDIYDCLPISVFTHINDAANDLSYRVASTYPISRVVCQADLVYKHSIVLECLLQEVYV